MSTLIKQEASANLYHIKYLYQQVVEWDAQVMLLILRFLIKFPVDVWCKCASIFKCIYRTTPVTEHNSWENSLDYLKFHHSKWNCLQSDFHFENVHCVRISVRYVCLNKKWKQNVSENGKKYFSGNSGEWWKLFVRDEKVCVSSEPKIFLMRTLCTNFWIIQYFLHKRLSGPCDQLKLNKLLKINRSWQDRDEIFQWRKFDCQQWQWKYP